MDSVNGHHDSPAVEAPPVSQNSSTSSNSCYSSSSGLPSISIANGSLPCTPRALTSVGEEFFGDDPLPDADWELRSLHLDAVPADMSHLELRRLMGIFGQVEDVQLIQEKENESGGVSGHVVFRHQGDADVARRSVVGEQSLITLRELNPEENDTVHEDDEEEEEERGAKRDGDAYEDSKKSPEKQQTNRAAAPMKYHAIHHHHMPLAPQLSPFVRNMVPQPAAQLPFPFFHPVAAGGWGGGPPGGLYYPLPGAHLYGGLAASGAGNYLLSGPQQQPQSGNPGSAAMVNRKSHRGLEDGDGPCVRLVVHTRLVGAIIGVGGATIRRITRHQVRVDVDNNIMKRPWPPTTGRHQDNEYRGVEEDGPRTLQSQVVFIYGAQEAVERAVQDIMQLVQREARSKKLEHEPDLALLVDNALCGRIIGKGGHKIKRIRENTEVDIILCNETIIRYEDMYHVYMSQGQYDLPSLRIISLRGELDKSLEAFRQLLTSINEIRRRSPIDNSPGSSIYAVAAAAAASGHMGPLAGFVPARPLHYPNPGFPPPNLSLRQPGPYHHHYLPAVHRIPTAPNASRRHPGQEKEGGEEDEVEKTESGRDTPAAPPPPLHLDLESLYVLVPNSTGGAIIGTEGRNIHKIMEMTAASVTVSKHQPNAGNTKDSEQQQEKAEDSQDGPGLDDSGNSGGSSSNNGSESKRLVTIRANAEQSLDLALHFIFRKVQSCRRDGVVASRGQKTGTAGLKNSTSTIYTVMRVPKALMGRLCGRHHQNVTSIQRHSNAVVEMSKAWFSDLLPSNRAEDNDGVEFDNIFIQGDFSATQMSLVQLRARLLEAYYAHCQQHGLPVPLPSYQTMALQSLAQPHAGPLYPSSGPSFAPLLSQASPAHLGLMANPGPGPVLYRHLNPLGGVPSRRQQPPRGPSGQTAGEGCGGAGADNELPLVEP